MNFEYFQKINNTYKSKNKQETDLYLLNRHIDKCFDDTIDYQRVKRNGEPYELIIIKDTDNNTFKKKIKSRHSEPFNLGDYIEWNNQIWLVTLLDSDDKTYHSGYMYLCTFALRWQNSDGKIIERFAYSEDFTKYSTGTTGNNTITVGDNQYGLTLPVDSETKKLRRDMRFPIDFDDAEEPDIYILSNRKVNLNNNEYFGRGATMVLTMSFNAFNRDKDKRVILDNGKEVWICDYKDPSSPTQPDNPNKTDDLSVTIDGNTNLKVGFSRTYTAILVDKNGNAIQWDDAKYSWNVVSDFDDEIEQTVDGEKIKLKVDNEELVDEKFRLQLLSNDIVYAEIIINISGF